MPKLLQAVKERFALDDTTPAVVRISQFPAHRYSGHLGRSEASRVFTIHLGSVWNMTIKDIAKYSGFTLTPVTDDNQSDVLFIWVFVPSHPDQVVPATWGHVLAESANWIQ